MMMMMDDDEHLRSDCYTYMGDEELMNSYMIRIDARYCPVKKVFCGFPMPRWLGQNTAAIPAHAAVLTNHQPNHVTLVARDLGCQRTFVLDKSTIAHPPATSLSRPSNNNNKKEKRSQHQSPSHLRNRFFNTPTTVEPKTTKHATLHP